MASTIITACYVAVLLLALVYMLYKRSLPRPIPGNIPYNQAAATMPFGDVSDIFGYEEPISFFQNRCHELNSPIIQLFLEPFGRPSVIIADARETHDILARRTKEFDRAKFFSDLFVSVAPRNQVCLPTGDQWHANRKLMADTMSPGFLAQSAAPQAQFVFMTFLELWRARSRLAKGRPFDAEQDVDCAMLDAITAIAFGSSSHATEAERDFAISSSSATTRENTICEQTVVEFARQPPPPEHSAVELLAHSAQIAGDSPLGAWHHWFVIKVFPKYRAAMALRRKILSRQVNIAVQKFSNPGASGDEVRSAADLIVSREIAMAKKEGRQPRVYSPIIDDELFGFVVAGYDTTSTTIKWGLKLLSQHQDVQKKLRSELRAAFKTAADSGTLPSHDDIAKHRPVYLDAVIEEILRIGNPGVMPLRTSTVDTTVLGHFIPKGTDVIMLNVGPSQTEAPMPIEESTRSKTSQESIDTAYTGNWDPETLGEFLPERWLSKNAKGDMEFNPRAGAQQTFGGGLRGCFGRKLAYVILRIVFTYVTWEFNMLPVEGELGTMSKKFVLTCTPVRCFVKLRNITRG